MEFSRLAKREKEAVEEKNLTIKELKNTQEEREELAKTIYEKEKVIFERDE